MEDFYVVIDGQKQGPFDIISMIRKVKNGVVTAETKIATSADGDFLPAKEVQQLGHLLEELGEKTAEGAAQPAQHKRPSLGLMGSFSEGGNLWLKYVLSFTILSGAILTIAFSLSKGLGKIDQIAQYPTIGYYIVSVITAFLYTIFFNYILLAKRNQASQMGVFFKTLGSKISSLLLLSAIFSVYTLGYGLNEVIGLAVLVVVLILTTFYIFTPFLIFERDMSFGQAARTSIKKVTKAGADNFGVILTLVAVNLIVAIVPAFFAKDLFVFGLFISLPITVSALAFIYDEIFA